MEAIKRKNKRYRLRKGRAFVLAGILIVALGFWFYLSRQPKVSFNSNPIVEYGMTDEEAQARLVNEESSRFDTIEVIEVDSKSITQEDAEPVYAIVSATYKGTTKEFKVQYSVQDTVGPEVSVPSDTLRYTDAGYSTLVQYVRNIKAIDPVDGSVKVYFSSEDSKVVKYYDADEMIHVVSQLIFDRSYSFFAYGEDATGNITKKPFSVIIDDGAMDATKIPNMTTELSAEYAVVYDLESQSVLYGKDNNASIYPASMTKMMTVYAALSYIESGVTQAWNNNQPVTLESMYKVPTDIDWVHAQDASNAGIWGGDIVSIRDLLYGVMLPSGADAAYALSYALTGTQDGLVSHMNTMATQLGMTATHYTNPTGLHDDKHVTSLDDLIKLMTAAWASESYKTVMSSSLYVTDGTYNKGKTDVYESHSLNFLKVIGNTSVIASKSGYTDESGRSLAAVVQVGEKTYFVIVNKSTEDSTGMSAVMDVQYLIQSKIQ